MSKQDEITGGELLLAVGVGAVAVLAYRKREAISEGLRELAHEVRAQAKQTKLSEPNISPLPSRFAMLAPEQRIASQTLVGNKKLKRSRHSVRRHRSRTIFGVASSPRQLPPAPPKIAASIEVSPPAKTNKLEKPPRHKAPRAVVQRICDGVRELQAKRLGCPVEKLDTRAKGERVRLTRDEWMEIVRAEYPGVNWGFVQQVRTQVYDFKRSKTKDD